MDVRWIRFAAMAATLAGLLAPSDAVGQAVAARNIQTITLDPATGLRHQVLPFDEQFLLSVPVPNSSSGAQISMIPLEGGGPKIDCLNLEARPNRNDVAFLIPRLPANREYRITVLTFPQGNNPKCGPTTLTGAEPYTGETRASLANHFDTDFGVIGAPGATRYSGVLLAAHLHFAPINKNAPDDALLTDWKTRWSVFAGLSVFQLYSGVKIEKASAAGFPTFGVGVRVGEKIRAVAGAMFFEQTDANPVIDTRRDKWTPILGGTVDFELKTLLGPLAALVNIK